MKVTNWRRKLMASLVAGGLLSPAGAIAANLDSNLVNNPGFETVDVNVSQGGYNAVQILGWNDGTELGFAYSHNGSLNGMGQPVPDFANGGPLVGGGSFYFTSNATDDDINQPGQFAQNIDVSTGPTGSLIPTGEAAIKLSGFFSSYLTNNDFGTLHVEFLDADAASLGTIQVSDSDVSTWTQDSAFGIVPVGTATLRTSLFGTPFSGGPDGYIDNVDVQITAAASELMFLEVNTSTGQVAIKNQTGQTIHIDYYEITSAGNALKDTAWDSLQEQDRPGFPAGSGAGNGWEEFGGSSSSVIGESYLTGNSALANDASIGLGPAFNVGGAQDLMFKYGAVTATAANPTGDYNNNGTVDAADYVLWRKNLNQNVTLPNDSTPGTVTQADYDEWRANFGAGGGPSGPSTLTTGFVRYVTAGSAAAAPECSTLLLVGIGVASLAVGGRQRK